MIVAPVSLKIKIRKLQQELKYYQVKFAFYEETRGTESKMAVLYRQAVVITQQELQSLEEKRRHDYPQLAGEVD